MSYDYEIDSLREELDSALRHIADVALGDIKATNAAWWLCANHPKWVSYQPDRSARLVAMASEAGTPPKGKNWKSWFTRFSHHR